MRRLGVLLFACALAAPAFATDITRESVIAAMNAYRAENHVGPLREESRLDAAAEDRMKDMEDLGYWAHESPDGRTPFLWFKVRAYDFKFAGENLATGFDTAEVLLSAWMESPGHRANILSSDYEDCGVAIIDGATTGRRTGKSVVVLFGRLKEMALAAK